MDSVTVTFDEPRECKRVKKSYWLGELQLPVSETELHTAATEDGERVVAVTVPRFIAEDRGLVEPQLEPATEAHDDDAMSREDWFMLGLTMAMLVRGESPRDAVWEARKALLELSK